MRDLNLKGAGKENTDMDVFNTAEALPVANCTIEVIPKEEVIEVPAASVQQQQLPQQPPPQKLPDVKTMPEPKVDVDGVVKEVPSPLEPQPQCQVPQPQPTTDSQDETYRPAPEKLVQVKNETIISKTNSTENSDTQVSDQTVLKYKKDQWSPLNTGGKKCYDRDFLITLQSNPKCKKKPDNLPDLEVVLKDNSRARMDPLNRPSEALKPALHKSSAQRGPLPKCKNKQGKALLANDEFIDKLVDNVIQRLDKKLEEQKAYYEYENAIAKITADYKNLEERLEQQEQYFRRNYIRLDQIDRGHRTGTDGFSSVATPTGFVSQQISNQPTNHGPTIRGMTQSGPPNQSLTPPQNDINKMQPPQPGQLQMSFMPQQVHSAQAQSNYFRPPAPNQGGPWMSNHNRQTMTSTAAAAPPMYSQHMTHQLPLQNYAQRPYYTSQSYPTMFPSQYMQGTYQAQQPYAQQFYLQSATPKQMTARQGLPPVPPRNAPSPQQQKPVMFAPAPVSPKRELNPEQLKLRMRNIMEEYLNDCCTLKDCESDIKARIDQSKLQEFVMQGYHRVLERSATTRRKAGKLFAYLTKNETLSNDDMCKALTEVLSQADDLEIDMPKLWDYLAEMILPLVAEGVVPLDKLRSCSNVLVSQGHAHKLIASLLKLLVADNGPNYVSELWKSAGVQFSDFMSADIVDTYVKENNFDFLLGSWNQVHNKLLQFFKSNTTLRTVTDWIYANVGDRVKENQFIRTLVTAIVENAVHEVNGVMKLRSEVLAQHYLLLQRFVDNQERRELQCLFALQALVHKWKHPPGLLVSIFERFWEDGLLSNDSFRAWEKCTDPAEQEGKGVALKSMQSLFTSLKEAEDESGSSTSDEA